MNPILRLVADMKPRSGVYDTDLGGEVFRYTNDEENSVNVEYVEFTAPEVCLLQASVDGVLCVKAWAGAGGAHSWWTAAGGRFMRYPLKQGQTLSIVLSGMGAVRLDWYE